MATKKRLHKAPGKTEKTEKTINDLIGKGGTDKSYPWALFADCVLMLVFIFANGWKFKLDIQIYFVIAAAVIFIIQMIWKENRKRLFNRISFVIVILIAQCLLYFAGLFYAYCPKFALQELFMNVGALFVFATAYVSFLKNELNFKRLVLIVSAVMAFATLISIELATSGLLSGIIAKIGNLLNAQIADGYAAFETNTRITTVLGTPNVFAPMCVLAMFGSLWSCGRTGEHFKSSFIHLSLAVVCGIGFILCFSLGTILSYAAVLLIYIIVTPRGEKSTQLFRHLYCLVFSLVGSGVVFAIKSMSILPVFLVILLSLLASFTYTRIKPINLPPVLPKSKWYIIAGISVLCTVCVLLSVSLHGSYSMKPGETFKRAVSLKPGTYALHTEIDTSDTSKSLIIDISSQNYTEASLKIKTRLAQQTIQPGEAVDFTVPEGSAAVFITFSATNDIDLTDAVIKGSGTSLNLPLRYKVLPEFIVNRLQGLWVNDNAIQRFVFFRDGIRLGMRSPIIGLGGGAYEGGVFSVSDYSYQTKHVHNEFIQRFIDGGVLGLLLFAALPFALFRALYKAQHNEKMKPYFAFLFACMAMIFLHALLEVDFLMVGYRIAVMVLFAGVAALGEDRMVIGKKVQTAIKASFVLTIAVTVLLSFGRYFANKAIDRANTLESVQDAIWKDPFNKTDYMLSFLFSTTSLTDPYFVDIQNKYLNTLDNQIVGADAVAQIYLTRNQPDGIKGTKAAELFIRERRVDSNAWNMMLSLYFSVLSNNGIDSATRNAVEVSAHRLLDYLDELNETLPLQINPDQNLLSVIRTSIGRQEQ